MHNLLNSLFEEMTTLNQNIIIVGNKTLFVCCMLLYTIIPTIKNIKFLGGIEILPFLLQNSVRGLFGYVFSLGCRWVFSQGLKRYKAYKRTKKNGKEIN